MPSEGYWGRTKPPAGTLLDRGHSLMRSLVGFWAANEGNGSVLLDASGQGRVLPLAAGASSPGHTSSREGFALKGDGSTIWYSLANGSALIAGSAATFWVRLISGANYGANHQHVWGMRDDGVADAYILRLGGSADYEVRWRGSSGVTATTTLSSVPQGLHTIALIYNGGTGTSVYLDAVSKGTGTGITSITSTTQPFELLNSIAAALQCANELVISAGVWSRALPAAELGILHSTPYAMFAPPVWRRYFVPQAAAAQDTPELRGRPFGLRGQDQMAQLLAQ